VVLAAAACALLVPATAAASSPTLVISQLYGGGGNSGATYANDFVELHNRSASAVSTSGWSIQYASAAGTVYTNFALPASSIPAGGYYLIGGASGGVAGSALPTPDFSSTLNMAAGAGKLRLMNTGVLADFVGYGATATEFEGSGPAPTASNTTADFRGSSGCQDTDNNATDFSAALPSPRNSGTAAAVCANAAPVAVNDSYSLSEDGTLAQPAPGVLANDTDSDGGPLTAQLEAGPAHGDLTLNADGSFTYTPAANYSGSDSFTYRAVDNLNAQSGVATVTLTVDPANDAPTAADDAYSTTQGAALSPSASGGVLANDSDIDGDVLTAVLGTGPSHGALTLNSDGSFTYTPSAGYVGADSFTYTARDPSSTDSAPATVTIQVQAAQAPGGGGSAGGSGQQAAPPDTTKPAIAFKGSSKLKLDSKGRLKVAAGCSEAAKLAGKGFVTVKGSSKRYALGAAGGNCGPGSTTSLLLKLSKKSRAAIVKALKRHKKVTATVTLTATDAAGNAGAAQRKLALKR
jgi:VCBS repeat-containing protein